jgi:hypothetical protein
MLAFHSEAICEPISQADAWREHVLGVEPMFGNELMFADEPAVR